MDAFVDARFADASGGGRSMNEYKQGAEHCDDLRCACRKHFITVPEVARLVRKSDRTIYRWLGEGYLPAKKIKNSWLIEPKDLFSLLG